MRRNPILWKSWLRNESARLKIIKRSNRYWSSQAGISEHTLRRALAGDESIGYGNIEALLVAAKCRFKFHFPNGEGGFADTILEIKRPLRDAVDHLLRVALPIGWSGVKWAKMAKISEATIRRLQKGDPNIGIGILARLLESANCSVARVYRPTPVLVLDPVDFPAEDIPSSLA
jgi:hypothetical protein